MQFTAQELVTTFPEALKDIKRNYRLHKKMLAQLEEDSKVVLQAFFDITAARADCNEQLKALMNRCLIKLFYTDIKRGLQELIATDEECLAYVLFQQAPPLPKEFEGMVEQSTELINDFDIQRAKAIPLTRYLSFNKGGFAQCPFHKERTPSMKYYKDKNTAHCFGGCGRSWSVIDIVMHRYQIDFKKAVLFLNHG